MDIYEELHSRYIQLYASAMDLDKDHHTKFDLVMKKYQKMWDDGFSILPATNMMDFMATSKRKPEDEKKELSLLMEWTADKVFDIIIENWLSKLTREQVVFMLNAVSELDYNAQLSFEKSHSITPSITPRLGNRWRCFIVKMDLQNLDHGLNGATPL